MIGLCSHARPEASLSGAEPHTHRTTNHHITTSWSAVQCCLTVPEPPSNRYFLRTTTVALATAFDCGQYAVKGCRQTVKGYKLDTLHAQCASTVTTCSSLLDSTNANTLGLLLTTRTC